MKIHTKELTFTFRFKQVKELSEKTGKELQDFESIAKDFKNAPLILSIGANIPIEEAEELLQEDERGFGAVTEIINTFTEQVVNYLTPNLQSQTA